MRFLVDECTGPTVAKWLKSFQFEVFSVFDNARGLNDEEIIKKAFEENYIIITNDKDFGELVHRNKMPHKGIILLRLDDERPDNKISILNHVLNSFSDSLKNNFIIVTEDTIRIVKDK